MNYVTVAQLLAIPNDQLTNGTYLPGSIVIQDTSANLASHASAILALGSLVSGIQAMGVLTVAHALSLTALLPLMSYANINDTEANVLSHTADLAALKVP